ncbi:MAG: TetR/AcrR family transcriptional regulator [Syntrophales bacterium]|nr:TetR/AcrR family transcriptional regulator [Syntrophales bacterium]MDY0044448.1 TetR family transcriptional regulator C-terminal domain-containing protein [Syntrophales bacterium]
MSKSETKLRIVKKGAQLVHAKGFNNTGIQEILDAAGIPKGSFYFYFKNKEDFGLHIIEHYGEILVANALVHLCDSTLTPLERIDRLLETNQQRFEKLNFKYGCPIGNMMQEMADLNDSFRERITQVYSKLSACIEVCIREGQETGHIPAKLDAEETAHFIMNSWEGAIMHMKLTKDERPLTACRKHVKDKLTSE